jgi:hypothetical protein
MSLGNIRVDYDGAADQVGRLPMPTGLGRNQTEKIGRREIPGIYSQYIFLGLGPINRIPMTDHM